MKKISEMTEDEVREYALDLEQKTSAQAQAMADKDSTITQLKDDIVGLQRRNNSLYMKIEQQREQPPQLEEQTEKPSESLEDFAKNNYKEYIK